MSDKTESAAETGGRDYSDTLFLPKTDFPMRAGLPQKEPEIVARWQEQDMYRRLRDNAKGREKYVLHDGPPYANGNIHMGTGLNKILKDVVTRSFQMRNRDSNYVPGWDCHGLPIEWKIEEQYRAKGRNKDDVPINEFRKECRDFAAHWVGVQSEEFQRLGVVGDFANPYLTMNFAAEAIIAGELMKFARSGQLYRGSKPIMWSVVERTALAEAEIEYETYESDTVWVGFLPPSGLHAGPLRKCSRWRVLGRACGSIDRCINCHLDNHPVDHAGQPCGLILQNHLLRPLRNRHCRERFRPASRGEVRLCRQTGGGVRNKGKADVQSPSRCSRI